MMTTTRRKKRRMSRRRKMMFRMTWRIESKSRITEDKSDFILFFVFFKNDHVRACMWPSTVLLFNWLDMFVILRLCCLSVLCVIVIAIDYVFLLLLVCACECFGFIFGVPKDSCVCVCVHFFERLLPHCIQNVRVVRNHIAILFSFLFILLILCLFKWINANFASTFTRIEAQCLGHVAHQQLRSKG